MSRRSDWISLVGCDRSIASMDALVMAPLASRVMVSVPSPRL